MRREAIGRLERSLACARFLANAPLRTLSSVPVYGGAENVVAMNLLRHAEQLAALLATEARMKFVEPR
jgi:hypothetical protein